MTTLCLMHEITQSNIETKRTYTTPGAVEARYVAANALMASADLAALVLFFRCYAPPPRGLPTTHRMRRSTPAFSTDNYSTRYVDFTALDRLPAGVLKCWGPVIRDVTINIHPVVGTHTYRKKCEFGESNIDGRRPRLFPHLQGPSSSSA